MRRLVTLVALFACAGIVAAATTLRVAKVPEGVEIHGEIAKVKPGYAIRRVSRNNAVTYLVSKGSITGDFKCSCKSDSGTCDLGIGDSEMKCVVAGGCTGCEFIVVVKGGKVDMLPVH